MAKKKNGISVLLVIAGLVILAGIFGCSLTIPITVQSAPAANQSDPADTDAKPTLSEDVDVSLQESGTLASDQPTNMDGYQASPIGALNSNLPLVCETWGPTPTGNHGFVVTVPAGSVMWEQRHFGGTCWWVDPSDLEAAIQRSVDNVTNTNGEVPTVVRLATDTFPLLGCLQSQPVENGVRHCDPVGGFPGYDSPAENPNPGYFPGYDN